MEKAWKSGSDITRAVTSPPASNCHPRSRAQPWSLLVAYHSSDVGMPKTCVHRARFRHDAACYYRGWYIKPWAGIVLAHKSCVTRGRSSLAGLMGLGGDIMMVGVGARRDFLTSAGTGLSTNMHSNGIQLHLHSLREGLTEALFVPLPSTMPRTMTSAIIDNFSSRAKHFCGEGRELCPRPHRASTRRRTASQQAPGLSPPRSQLPASSPPCQGLPKNFVKMPR